LPLPIALKYSYNQEPLRGEKQTFDIASSIPTRKGDVENFE
jgi:hypothetical protein